MEIGLGSTFESPVFGGVNISAGHDDYRNSLKMRDGFELLHNPKPIAEGQTEVQDNQIRPMLVRFREARKRILGEKGIVKFPFKEDVIAEPQVRIVFHDENFLSTHNSSWQVQVMKGTPLASDSFRCSKCDECVRLFPFIAHRMEDRTERFGAIRVGRQCGLARGTAIVLQLPMPNELSSEWDGPFHVMALPTH